MRANLYKYRIEYDIWFHESTLYANGELEQTLAMMKDRGLTYEKDGALWYKNSEVLAEKTARGRENRRGY
jgi:arginyl-tRNA synthetase